MRRLAILIVVSLILLPYSIVRAQSAYGPVPPIEQPLVREGDFAVKLAQALNLNSSNDEAAAEDSLISAGIYPRNGWIRDYPVTPYVLAEVLDSTRAAADSGKLGWQRNEALRMIAGVSEDLGLPISMVSGLYGPNPGMPPEAPYIDPYAVQDYYTQYGPPVVSYYPPPDDYGYLYSYVDYPFWWDGWGFGGFFILNNFNKFHHHHDHEHGSNWNGSNWSHVSNSVQAANGAVSTVDPAPGASSMRWTGNGRWSAQSAGSVMSRDMDRFRSNRSGVGNTVQGGSGTVGTANHAPSASSTGATGSSTWSTQSAGSIVRHDADRFQSSRSGVSQSGSTTGSFHSGSVSSFATPAPPQVHTTAPAGAPSAGFHANTSSFRGSMGSSHSSFSGGSFHGSAGHVGGGHGGGHR
jgi:hypothetical protein